MCGHSNSVAAKAAGVWSRLQNAINAFFAGSSRPYNPYLLFLEKQRADRHKSAERQPANESLWRTWGGGTKAGRENSKWGAWQNRFETDGKKNCESHAWRVRAGLRESGETEVQQQQYNIFFVHNRVLFETGMLDQAIDYLRSLLRTPRIQHDLRIYLKQFIYSSSSERLCRICI